MAVNVGDIIGGEQAAGLQRAGYRLARAGSGGPQVGEMFQIVGVPSGLSGAGGGGEPLGTKTERTGTSTGERIDARSLPPEISEQLKGLIGGLMGRGDFGFTPEELAAMRIGPEEARGLVGMAQAPIAGVANKARSTLMRQAAARGNYLPGLNAAVECTQQEEGRQAARAVTEARLGISAANRAAALAAANARISEQSDVSRQAGGLLQAYPEFTAHRRPNKRRRTRHADYAAHITERCHAVRTCWRRRKPAAEEAKDRAGPTQIFRSACFAAPVS